MLDFQTDFCPHCLNRRSSEVDAEVKARFIVGVINIHSGQCDRCLYVGKPEATGNFGSDTDEISVIEHIEPDGEA